MRTHMVARGIVELYREINGLDGTPIFRTLCGAVGRSLELRDHPRERERERQGTEAPCFPRECSGWREPPPFFRHAGQRSLMPSAMSRSCRTSGGTPRLTVRPFQGVLGSLPVTRHVSLPRLRLQHHHKHRRELRDGLQASKFRLRAITCAQHVPPTACTG